MENLLKRQHIIWIDILAERIRQNILYSGTLEGPQSHNISTWANILNEQAGKVATEVTDMVFDVDHPKDTWDELMSHLRSELIQVAAVAVAIIERIDDRDYALLTPEEQMQYLRSIGPLIRDIIQWRENAV